jgi:hypothetical protein
MVVDERAICLHLQISETWPQNGASPVRKVRKTVRPDECRLTTVKREGSLSSRLSIAVPTDALEQGFENLMRHQTGTLSIGCVAVLIQITVAATQIAKFGNLNHQVIDTHRHHRHVFSIL